MEVAGSQKRSSKKKITLRDAGFAAGGAGLALGIKWAVKKIAVKLAEAAFDGEDEEETVWVDEGDEGKVVRKVAHS